MDYAKECQWGREIAANEIAECQSTGDYPKFTQTVRDFASQRGGVSIGFLQAIAEKATR